jgi:hypothetical protein
MRRYAEVDASGHPVIKVQFTGEESNDENFSLYLKEVRACYDKGERIAIIFDANKASLPKYAHILMQAQWLKDHTALMRDWCSGTAYVVPNAMLRGVLNMIFTLQKQPVPFTIVGTVDLAMAWIRQNDATLLPQEA